jgi:O-antigen ligase/polysaccharide polymerase Wzy-like membrane protein
MFVIPGIVAMLAYVYIHPQEVWEALRVVSFPMVLAFAAFGHVLDVRVGATPLRPPSLLLSLGIAFYVWAALTIGINAPDTITETLNVFAAAVGLFLAIALGVSTLRAFRVVTVALLAITMLLALVAIHQGVQPTVCVLDDLAPKMSDGDSAVGRPCIGRADCTDNLGRDYVCEHAGLMNTTSIGGRVRYSGILADPNELAWALNIALPFIFVWYERRAAGGARIPARIVVAVVLAACILCNVMTQSRSGQISLLATLGVYFIRRFGWRGIAFGAAMALPILLFGGRSDAESSTQERLECWSEALGLWREHPFFGVGARQFTQHHYLTAHNSALLALAELGPIGLLLFTAMVYLAFKITLQVHRDLAGKPEAAEARAIAFGTVAALVGMTTSALFLSLTYHPVLWVVLGLAVAVQSMMLRHNPEWRLRWRWRDTATVVGLDVALVVGIAVYLRIKGV